MHEKTADQLASLEEAKPDIPRPSLLGTSAHRFWKGVLLLLVLVECMPIWLLSYCASTDGPSHLHNAQVWAHPGIAIYREYYARTSFQAAGNVLTQLLLAGSLRLVSPLLAEKLLLTCYVLLFFASFYYFLHGISPYADYFSCFAGILVSNFFFYMGFWNFLYSLCLALLTLGYYLRHQHRWTYRSLAVLIVAGFVIYMTHAVSWGVCVGSVAVLSTPVLSFHRGHRRSSELHIVGVAHWAKGVCSLLLPICLLVWYWWRTPEDPWHIAMSSSMAPHYDGAMIIQRLSHPGLRPLLQLEFLSSFTTSERIWAVVVSCTLLIIGLYSVGVACWKLQYKRCCTRFVITSLVWAGIYFVAPDNAGGASYLRLRVALYIVLFLVAGLAECCPQSRLGLNIVAALLSCLSILGFALRLPDLVMWNQRLAAVCDIGQYIQSGSTVLQLNLDYPSGRNLRRFGVEPYSHCVGLISASKVIVDLRNYEASTTHFLTRFRPEVRPFSALGTPDELQSTPPIFDIGRYESETRGRVDYLLFQGGAGKAEGGHGLEYRRYPGLIGAYKLVASAEPGNLKLYERVPGSSIRPDR